MRETKSVHLFTMLAQDPDGTRREHSFKIIGVIEHPSITRVTVQMKTCHDWIKD